MVLSPSIVVCYYCEGCAIWGAYCVIHFGKGFILMVDVYHSVVDIYINPLWTLLNPLTSYHVHLLNPRLSVDPATEEI